MIDDDEQYVEGEEVVLDDSVLDLQKEFDKITFIDDENERLEAAKLLMGRLSNG